MMSLGCIPARRSRQLRNMHNKNVDSPYVSYIHILVSYLTRRRNRLSDCGHTFCQPCLRDWFNTSLTQFLATNPHLRHMQALPQAALYQQAPHYTCPTCRTTVKSSPVEVFALKALVRTIATAAGESSPKKPPAAAQHGGGMNRAQGVHTPGPWDGFFPRRI